MFNNVYFITSAVPTFHSRDAAPGSPTPKRAAATTASRPQNAGPVAWTAARAPPRPTAAMHEAHPLHHAVATPPPGSYREYRQEHGKQGRTAKARPAAPRAAPAADGRHPEGGYGRVGHPGRHGGRGGEGDRHGECTQEQTREAIDPSLLGSNPRFAHPPLCQGRGKTLASGGYLAPVTANAAVYLGG